MKTAIVTGVSRGLGKALVDGLLDIEYDIIGIGRSSHVEFEHDKRYRFISCDLRDASSLKGLEQSLMTLADAQHEQLVLINNAATASPVGVFGDLSDDEISSSLQLNLISVIQLSNLFCQCFASMSCDKRIINISSGAAFTAIPGSGVYCIAKAGMEMLTQSIAAEISHHGISAVSIQPGVIDTDMQTWLRQQSAEALPSVGMYQAFQQHQQLLPTASVAENIIKSAVLAPARNGESFSHDQ